MKCVNANSLLLRNFKIVILVVFLVLAFFTPLLVQADTDDYSIPKHDTLEQNTPEKALLLYAVDETDALYVKERKRHLRHFSQILQSHWEVDVTTKKLKDYEKGALADYDVLLVSDGYGEDAFYRTLKQDILNYPDKTLVFTGFSPRVFYPNLFRDEWIDKTEGRSRVHYKDVTFSTEDLVEIDLFKKNLDTQNGDKKVLSTYQNGRPFIVNVDERVFLMPFAIPYWYETERYTTVFLDAFHDVLGRHGKENRKALVRLEDVNTFTYRFNKKLGAVYDHFKTNNIPFQMAVIPRFIYPEKDIDWEIGDRPRFLNMLREIEEDDLGTLIMHGYTHQMDDQISGVGYEFWDADRNAPRKDDSVELVNTKSEKAKEVFRQAGLVVPDIWETPHYALSLLDSRTLNDNFQMRYEQIPQVGSLPFPVKIDGTIYLPENLGYVFKRSDLQDKEMLLKQLSVFEDPVASFFWHPWRDKSEIVYLTELLQGEGYEFTGVYDLLEQNDDDNEGSYMALTNAQGYDAAFMGYRMKVAATMTTLCFFLLGLYLYLRNVILIRHYAKRTQSFLWPIDLLKMFEKYMRREIPQIAIFVPARNEGDVIENTVNNLASLDYPKDHYRIFIIVDERELDDDVEVFTKTVVERLANEYKDILGEDFIRCVEVPKWYSGVFGDRRAVYEKSTKGRALNYALEVLEEDEEKPVEMIGVLDADGRLDKNVLKEVGYRRMSEECKILQGPVFQFSNFRQSSIVGVAAGIELAIHHLTELPRRLISGKRIQFLAGTNYFIDKNLIAKVGGWDPHALVEDAELALRIYLKERVVASWMDSPEIEQTPPKFAIYRKQRERWVRGNLSLIGVVVKSTLPLFEKIEIVIRVVLSQFRFLIDLAIPVIAVVLLLTGAYLDWGTLFSITLLLLAFLTVFVFDLYGKVYRKLSHFVDPRMTRKKKIVQSLKLFFFLPVMIVIQAIPRVDAIINMIRKKQTSWYKTERTKEVVDPQNITLTAYK